MNNGEQKISGVKVGNERLSIMQCNKLIVEFMGGAVNLNGTVTGYNRIGLPEHAYLLNDFDTKKIEAFQYVTDWDWIMPVVKKIGEYRLAFPKECNMVCGISIMIDLSSLYSVVVEFINWFNHRNKQQ